MIRWILAQIFAAALHLTMVLLRAYEILSVILLRRLPAIPRDLQAHTSHLTLVCRCKKSVVPVAVGVLTGRRSPNHPTLLRP